MSSHSICNNIKTKWQVPGIPYHCCCESEQTIFVQLTLFSDGLPATGNQLLKVEARVLIIDNRLYLLLREWGSVSDILCGGWCCFIAR
jgi:hypothetical protein